MMKWQKHLFLITLQRIMMIATIKKIVGSQRKKYEKSMEREREKTEENKKMKIIITKNCKDFWWKDSFYFRGFSVRWLYFGIWCDNEMCQRSKYLFFTLSFYFSIYFMRENFACVFVRKSLFFLHSLVLIHFTSKVVCRHQCWRRQFSIYLFYIISIFLLFLLLLLLLQLQLWYFSIPFWLLSFSSQFI